MKSYERKHLHTLKQERLAFTKWAVYLETKFHLISAAMKSNVSRIYFLMD